MGIWIIQFGMLCVVGEGLWIGMVWWLLCGVLKVEFVLCNYYDVWLLMLLLSFEFVVQVQVVEIDVEWKVFKCYFCVEMMYGDLVKVLDLLVVLLVIIVLLIGCYCEDECYCYCSVLCELFVECGVVIEFDVG